MSLQLEMPQNTPQKKRTKFSTKIFVFLLCIAIVALGWLFWTRTVSHRAEMQTTLIPIVSPMSSTLTRLATEKGAFVKAGQVIAYLDITEYMALRKEAEALVRGIRAYTAKNLAEDVASAQKAAEDMVQRLAMARTEEHTQKLLKEKYSLEHAKALLHRRNTALKNNPKALAEAEKAEVQAFLQLQQATNAFELASLSRVAVEKSIQQYRTNAAHAPSQNQRAQHLEALAENPGHIIAPNNGYIVGTIPQEGHVAQRGEKIFELLPEPQQGYTTTAIVSRKEGQNLALSMPCYVVLKEGFNLWQGNIVGIRHEVDGSHIQIQVKETWLSKPIVGVKQEAKVVIWSPKSDFAAPLLGILSFI